MNAYIYMHTYISAIIHTGGVRKATEEACVKAEPLPILFKP